MSENPRIVFWVQHLLGIGHIRRASLISQALADAGLDVTVILGGQDVQGIDYGDVSIRHLPSATAADEHFKIIHDENGVQIDDAWRANRSALLLDIVRSIRPDAVMFDLFPFGRRQFRFELLPLLNELKRLENPPLVVSSARDILVKKARPDRVKEQLDTLQDYFDKVLVHGDPRLVTFGETFPYAGEIEPLISYTGYVAPPPAEDGPSDPADISDSEVLVSAGGGVLGAPLFELALAARPLTRLRDNLWRILTGPNLPAADMADLHAKAGPDLIVETFRPDLPHMLQTARLSVSQSGYNTTMDILRARVPAVVVPISGGEETEQSYRAQLLADKGLLTLLPGTGLTPEALASAIDMRAMAPRPSVNVDLDGAPKTADILASELSKRVRER